MAANIVVNLANGEKAGETLKSLRFQAAALSKEVSTLKPGTDEFVRASQSLNQVKGRINDIDKAIRGTNQASSALREQFAGVLNQIPGFGAFSNTLSSMKGGVGGLTTQFGLLRGAIVATGIGALIVGITSLVTWFSKSEKGSKFLAQAFSAMGATVDTVLSRVWNLGETLRDLFSNPIQFFKNLGKDISDAASEGWNLTKVFDELEDRQREMDVRAKEQDIQVDRLLLQARNVGRTYAEKISLLERADKITRESYREQLALSDEYVKAVERELAQAEKSGLETDAIEDKLRDAKMEYLNLLGQEITIEEKIANRREQILPKKEADAKKEVQVEQQKAVEIKAIRDTTAADEERRIADAYNKRLAQAELDFTTDQNTLTEQFLAREFTEMEFAQQSAQRILRHHQERLGIIKEQLGAESLAYQEEYAKILSLQRNSAIASTEITQWMSTDGAKALTGSLSVFGQAFSQIASMHEQGSKSWKSFATAAATMSAISGAINAYASTAAIPVVGPTLAPFAAAVALAAGMFQVAKIRSVQLPKSPAAPSGVPKAAKGAVLSGPSHAAGGILVEAEGDEMIMTKGVYRDPSLRSMASWLNVQGGGIPLAPPINPFMKAARGFSSDSKFGADHASSNSESVNPFSDLTNSFKEFANEIRGWQTNIRVVNSIVDTRAQIDKLIKIENEWNV